MRTAKMEDLIRKSMARTKLVLFEPFSLKKWLKLLFIAAMAGALSSGSSGGGDWIPEEGQEAKLHPPQVIQFATPAHAYDLSTEDKIWGLEFQNAEVLTTEEGPDGNSDPLYGNGEDVYEGYAQKEDNISPFEIGMIVGFVVTIVILVFVLMWLTSRFKFIWYDAIVLNQDLIVAPFKRYRLQGDSYFKLSLVFLLLFILYFGGLGLVTFLRANSAGVFDEGFAWSVSAFFRFFGGPIVIAVISLIAVVIFGVCVDYFVVPIMAIDNIPFIPSWKKFFAVYKENAGDMWLFLLVVFGISIICGLIAIALVIFLFIMLLIVGLILFGLTYLLLVSLLKLSFIYGIFAVVAGIPFAIVAILLLMTTGLPFAVFFRAFSLYYLGSLGCGYVPIPLTEASEGGQAA